LFHFFDGGVGYEEDGYGCDMPCLDHGEYMEEDFDGVDGINGKYQNGKEDDQLCFGEVILNIRNSCRRLWHDGDADADANDDDESESESESI